MEEMNNKIEEVTEKAEERDLFSELRNRIIADRDKYKNQVHELKEKLEKMEEERKLLETLEKKLQGAIEASNVYLKAVLPSNNKK